MPQPQKIQYGCHLDPRGSGVIVCVDPPVCERPAVQSCSTLPPFDCTCELPPPVLTCAVTINYEAATPQAPQLGPASPDCDAAGMELAIAVILARLLGSP